MNFSEHFTLTVLWGRELALSASRLWGWTCELDCRLELADWPVIEDNIKKDLREIRCVGVGWFQLLQDMIQRLAFVNTVTNLRAPQNRKIY
jgi:hypothetical protein